MSILSTPSPEPDVSNDNATPASISTDAVVSHATNEKYHSPPQQVSIDLTPPLTSQIPGSIRGSILPDSLNNAKSSLASPPATIKPGLPALSTGIFGEIPTMDTVKGLNEEQLRSLVAELLPALGEARMSAAHAKLQHSLLSIENAESTKRAEVEHEMTRREVQVLQECNQIQRRGLGSVVSPRSPQSSTQRHLDLALKHCRDLQVDKISLEKKLRQAKKLILRLDGNNTELKEDIQCLRQRIKQNRNHLDAMRSSGAISVNGTPVANFGTPLHRDTPKTPPTCASLDVPNHVSSQDPFDALLFAGQVLSGEPNSVPTSPSSLKTKKPRSSHIRGAHSLSSLPVTPDRSRPITADGVLFTPINRSATEACPRFSAPSIQHAYAGTDHRGERDSTISASDIEDEACVDSSIPASQASQRAATMLRRLVSQKSNHSAVPKSGTVLRGTAQSRISGQLKKGAAERPGHRQKRGRDVDTSDEIMSKKKSKVKDVYLEKVGLGIANWSEPTH